MANTLVEYSRLVTNALKKGIAETIVLESPFLRYLPFKEIDSNAISYKMELTAAAADFYDVGGLWTEGTPTWDYRTATLYILGGDADVDSFAQATMKKENIKAEIISLKSKAVAQRFENCCILGRSSTSATYSAANIFKGLLRLIAECEGSTDAGLAVDIDGSLWTAPGTGNNTQGIVGASGASAALTLDMIDALCDVVKPRPTHLIMNRTIRRRIEALARAAGSNLSHDKDMLGMPVSSWGDYPILVSDGIPDNYIDPAALNTLIASYVPATAFADVTNTAPIFAVRIAEDGLCGLSQGMIQTEEIGTLETKDATRTRIKFYCGMALYNKRAAGVLLGTNVAG